MKNILKIFTITTLTFGTLPLFAANTTNLIEKINSAKNPMEAKQAYLAAAEAITKMQEYDSVSQEDKDKAIADAKKHAGITDDASGDKDNNAKGNRILTGLTTAATGIGGMQLAQGLTEQNADKAAEQDIAAYIATMRCTYGDGKSVNAGTEEIELPGGNDANLMKLRNEYFALAADLKERKTALGMKPGIESEEILDKTSTGLYDNENVGITSGAYSSNYRAQMLDSTTDQEQIDADKNTSKTRVIGGAVAAGVGVVGGVVGDIFINDKLDNKNTTKNINTGD